jgi:secreted trypsin-like serine protease
VVIIVPVSDRDTRLCSTGDSGGPLFRWYGDGPGTDHRAYIIGVVSRGTGCANFNQPGIYSRVSRHLDWIHEMTKDGNCNAEV